MERQGEQNRFEDLTSDEVVHLKEQLLQSIYADIGRSVIKRILWVGGSILVAILIGIKTGHSPWGE